MARRSNYSFERNARAKAKAEKREAKRQSKLAAKRANTQSVVPKPDSIDPKSADDVALDDSPASAEQVQRNDV